VVLPVISGWVPHEVSLLKHVEPGRLPPSIPCPQGGRWGSRSVDMPTTTIGDTTAQIVFRSRAVRTAGIIDFVVGLIVVFAGVGLAVLGAIHNALPLGLAIGIVGLILLLSGLSRMTARMEISKTHLTWTWSFSRQTLVLEGLDDAALVEKGAPASGAAWAGFLGGGYAGVLAWWLFDVCGTFFNNEPSLGSVELIAVKRYGGPVPIKPIGAWSTRSSHSEANQALHCLQAAIASSSRRNPAVPRILRTDAWEQLGDRQ
jgi:hypothetical protein